MNKFLCALCIILFLAGPVYAANKNIQRQINDINSMLDVLLGQSCPQGQYVTGISTEGNLICKGAIPSAETTHTMNCPKSDNSVGLVGIDPFYTSHANYELQFAPELVGRSITAIAVETVSTGSDLAYIQIENASTGSILATSAQVSTATLGWLEFTFTPNYVITGDAVIVNFIVASSARIYNCANTVEFTPSGLLAIGLGLENHLGRSYIKIKN